MTYFSYSVWAHVHLPVSHLPCYCGSQRTTYGNPFLLLLPWVQGIELRSPDLSRSACTLCAISSVLMEKPIICGSSFEKARVQWKRKKSTRQWSAFNPRQRQGNLQTAKVKPAWSRVSSRTARAKQRETCLRTKQNNKNKTKKERRSRTCGVTHSGSCRYPALFKDGARNHESEASLSYQQDPVSNQGYTVRPCLNISIYKYKF